MDLVNQIAELKSENEELKKLLATALLEIASLKSQISKNSNNSHKPPSSDSFKKLPAFPRIKGGRRGGKPGHKGNTLDFVATPDHEFFHDVQTPICECGQCLSEVDDTVLAQKRQVFDLPPRLIEVTEHRIKQKTCPGCGKNHQGEFPSQVNAPVQYGDRVRALIGLLNVEQSMPVGRVGELFSSLTGYEINNNTIVTAINRLSVDLTPALEKVKELILASPVVHADETGARIAGKLHWIHGMGTELYTYYMVHEKRGIKAMGGEQSLIAKYEGTLIHDFFATYFNLKASDHGMCGAHLIRELRALAELEDSNWARKMYDLLLYAYQFSENGKNRLRPEMLKRIESYYDQVISQAEQEEPPGEKSATRMKRTKGRNLMDRLKKYKSYVLNFARKISIPFTNNLGERDIRPWKTKLKVSGCFRTLDGANKYACVKAFCSTVRKNNKSVYQEFINAMHGKSFLTV